MRQRLHIALGAALLLALAGGATADVDERGVKAGLVINFAKFVEWPDDRQASAPIVIGVLEPDPFGRTLDRLATATTVGGRPLVVRRFGRPQDVNGAHVLYIGHACGADGSLALARIASGVLTVGDAEDFVTRGGVIRLYTAGDKVRFEASAEAAARSGLKVNPHLLKLGSAPAGPGERP